MALPRIYFIDTRVFKSGKKNVFLNNASTYNLNDLISQVVLNTIPGNPQLPLTINNGLTATTTNPGTEIQLGGILNQPTTVEGAGTHALSLVDMGVITLSGTSLYLSVDASGQFRLRTPNVDDTTAVQGALLQLKDAINGESEFTPYAFPLTDGTASYILQTDGAGNVTWIDPSTLANTIYNADDTLTGNRTVSGGGTFNLRFSNLSSFTVSNVSGGITLSSSSFIGLTPTELRILGLPNGSSVGRMLQLANISNSSVEWTPYELPTTAPNVNDMLVATSASAIEFQSQYHSVSYHIADSNVDLSTIAGTAAGNRFFSVPSRLNGWKLYSITLTSDSTVPTVTSLDYSVTLNTATTLTSDSWGGNAFEDDSVAAHTLATNDVLRFIPASGGNNILGLNITLTFVSN